VTDVGEGVASIGLPPLLSWKRLPSAPSLLSARKPPSPRSSCGASAARYNRVVSEVLYRKWRPQRFSEVVGQEPVTRTLRNSVSAGKLAHAYLFCGPRGTGKTTLGRLLAKVANCAGPVDGEPCNECASCLAFNEGRAMDFIEQDAASHNSVDDIRQLRENVILTPMAGGRKVYLLDEAHMLSSGAKNALLKTLEEPPDHIIFVLATTEPHKLDATITSRCQRFDLRRIPMTAVVERLTVICDAESYSLDAKALEEIARSATGSLRDAINGLEQVVAYYGTSPTIEQVREALGLNVDARSGELARMSLAGDLAGGFKLLASVRDDGADMKQFNKQVTGYLRNLLLAKTGALEGLDLPREAAEEAKEVASRLDRGEIVRVLRAFAEADFRDDSQSSLPLELAFVESASGVEDGMSQERGSSSQQGKAAAAPPVANRPTNDGGVVAAAPASEKPVEVAGAPPATPVSSGAEASLLDQVRQACKDSDRQLSGLLNGSCEVRSVDGDVVTLGFYHTFHLERIESGPLAKRLEEMFSTVLGRPVTLAFEHAPRERVASTSKGGHLVQAARELGAQPIGSVAAEGGPDGEPRRDES
jgi:DNA polymerase III subunit gamma/tau